MNPCSFEQQIITATKENRWTESLRQHLATCATCRAAHQFAMAFASVAEQTERMAPPMPAARLVLLRAEVSAKKESRLGLHILSAAVIGIMLSLGFAWLHVHGGTAGVPEVRGVPSPFVTSPFPLDSGLFLLVLAIALVVLLPNLGGATPKKAPDRLMSF